jgi:ornithine cyclodeaminase/alanine dehydrogenase-like protein (mu-crystallin family)
LAEADPTCEQRTVDVSTSDSGRISEVGEVVSGAKPGRRSAEEVTLFKSLGLAVEDVVTAGLVYRKALDGA